MKRVILFGIGAMAASVIAPFPAHSRDGWAEHPVCDPATVSDVEQCHAWISRVVQHDTRISCCGDADAFPVDRSFVRDGNFFVIVQGKEYLVPPNKINVAREDGGANQTGGELAFILQGTGEVVCYFAGTLT